MKSADRPTIQTESDPDPFYALAAECTVEAWLSILGHRWNALTLYHLSCGELRFGGLLARMPTLTPKVLTDRLRELQRRGLVEHDREGPDARYRLSTSGQALMPILHALEVWARTAPPDGPRMPAL